MSAGRAREEIARSSRSGFTLIELLTVMFIITALASLILYGAMKYRQSAYKKGTQGTLAQIKSAIERYHGELREYPPDGYDFEVLRDGTPIKGTACLIYFLAEPRVIKPEAGRFADERVVGPFLELTNDMLTGTAPFEDKIKDPRTELKDAWGNPLHYDNTEYITSGSAGTSRQTRAKDQSPDTVHSSTLEGKAHGPDPRMTASGVQPKSPGTFDLWSHGLDLDDVKDDIFAGESD